MQSENTGEKEGNLTHVVTLIPERREFQMLQMMELVQEEHSKTRDLGYICSIR